MPIPPEILSVERPVNTVVYAYGKNKDRYGVRKRVGCRYDKGKRKPINGPTVGYIIDGKYVPISENEPQKISAASIDLKDWGNVALCDTLFKDILQDLRAVYNKADAEKIYCISILRVCNKGVKDYELKEKYETSMLSELYPNVALSKNTVSTFINNLGKTFSRIVTFMRNRVDKVSIDDHLLIDGTLKLNDSKVNSLSNFSRKAKTRGRREISVLFAFNLEKMEPICSKCFPGNMLDLTAYSEFISQNNITKGIIVADKGFPESMAHEHFEKNPNLHYLNPIKRNSKLIKRHNMLDFTTMLPGYDGNITYRKEKCVGKNKYLYSYRDNRRAAIEQADWMHRSNDKNNYDLDELRKKEKQFGVIVLESDLDLSPEVIYKAYSSRWEIELVMRYYKSACEFNETRVQDDYSVIGSEFCDFLSTVLTFRLINEFDKVKLLEKNTYKEIMDVLERAKKAQIDDQEWQLIKMTLSQTQILQELELVPKPVGGSSRKTDGKSADPETTLQASDESKADQPRKRRRRPSGSQDKVTASDDSDKRKTDGKSADSETTLQTSDESKADQPRKRRRRPSGSQGKVTPSDDSDKQSGGKNS